MRKKLSRFVSIDWEWRLLIFISEFSFMYRVVLNFLDVRLEPDATEIMMNSKFFTFGKSKNSFCYYPNNNCRCSSGRRTDFTDTFLQSEHGWKIGYRMTPTSRFGSASRICRIRRALHSQIIEPLALPSVFVRTNTFLVANVFQQD